MPADVKIYNTLSRKKELLKPLKPGEVSIYACGVTVYDDCHIGHAMQAIFFDTFRNFLEFVGYKVTYVRNYTDVDDKIINKAQELGISPKTLSENVITSTEADMKTIGVLPATFSPKVSEHLSEIISMIETLVTKEAAYVTEEGDVYYKVKQKEDYGKLSGRKTDELKSGTRSITSKSKEDNLDFSLWKRDKTEDASWESPWGRGRPGWHIECSALSQKFLGNSFDIHGGGLDLKFPHHENEIAQSESANSCPYANIWIHTGLLTLNKQKMSKSLGNHIPIKKFLESWDAEVLRLGFIQNHYASNIDFSHSVFSHCRKRLYYYYQTLLELDKLSTQLSDPEKEEAKKLDNTLEKAFVKSMSDDFNTSESLAELNKFVREMNKLASKPNKENQKKVYHGAQQIRKIGKILGLFTQDPEAFIQSQNSTLLKELSLSEEEIEKKIKERTKARDQKDWKKSDEIRDELSQKGIFLKDSTEGTSWLLKEV